MKTCTPCPRWWLLFLLLSCAPEPRASGHQPPWSGAVVDPKPLAIAEGTADTGPTWMAVHRMAQSRSDHTSTLLTTGEVLVVGMRGGLLSAEAYDPIRDLWVSVGASNESRSRHTATLLPNGKVLIVGGYKNYRVPLSSAELYDPVTQSWSPAGSLITPRFEHTATLLPNGRVLVVGGANYSSNLNSVEEYDPDSNTWSAAPSLHMARGEHTANLLPEGQVLVLGGTSAKFLEIYDSKNREWSLKTMPEAVAGHTSTLLPDRRILVVGGVNADEVGNIPSSSLVRRYNPATNSWSTARPLAQARSRHTATLLPDGRVLVTGGDVSRYGANGSALESTEIYQPESNEWSSLGNLLGARTGHAATLLSTGKLLVTGGLTASGPTASAEVYDTSTYVVEGTFLEGRSYHSASLLHDGRVLIAGGTESDKGRSSKIYDPGTKSWSSMSPMQQGHVGHTATVLTAGKVLVVGGGKNLGTSFPNPVDSAELYDPKTGAWSFLTVLEPDRSHHTATLLTNGKVLVIGGLSASIGWHALSSALLYDPATQHWSSAGSMQIARGGHSATLLPNGKVLVVGGHSSLYSPLAIAELYDPTTNSWSFTGAMNAIRRAGHTATLLRTGKVLVIGGINEQVSFLRDMEEYDPVTNRWSALGVVTKPRDGHTATLLSNGKLLVVGGDNEEYLAAPSELYDPVMRTWSSVNLQTWRQPISSTLLPGGEALIINSSWTVLFRTALGNISSRPVIKQIAPATLEPGSLLAVTGMGFLGLSEASGGQTQSSSTNYPLLSLQSVDTGLWTPLPGREFSDASVVARLPYLPAGQYLLNVTTHAVTSGKVILITNTTPPKTRLIHRAPDASLTREPAATFSFVSEDVDLAAFECSLDDSPFGTCSSPKEYLSLRDGERVFRVRSRDLVGNVELVPVEHRWTVDTTPPNVSIKPEPPSNGYSARSTAVFLFTSEAPDFAFFECSLDGADFQACASPRNHGALIDGAHSFRVRAWDKAGNVAPPVDYRWTVDTVEPDPRLTSVPPRFTRSSESRFSFSAEPGVTFECSMDSVDFSLCASEQSYASLTEGKHSFRLRATDLAGNSRTSAAYEWVVDKSAPTPVIMGPAAVTSSKDFPFSFSSEADARFECRLDGVELTPCSSPQGYAALEDGVHTFEVLVTDPAGNTGRQNHEWVVDTVSPESPSVQRPGAGQRGFTARPVFAGTAEPHGQVQVFVDGALVAEAQADEVGAWEVNASPLTWGPHSFTATTTDRAGNTSPPLPESTFTTEQRGYYNLGCGASPASLPAWPLALLALGLSRRQHRSSGRRRARDEV